MNTRSGYIVVRYVGTRPTGRMVPETFQTRAELETWCRENGIVISGNHYAKQTRAELQGQPILPSFCGPMWDGGAVRYEDSISNDILSI